MTHSWEDKRVHTFSEGICPKVNVIARLEYELAYYDSAVHRFNHYTKRKPPSWHKINQDELACRKNQSINQLKYFRFL